MTRLFSTVPFLALSIACATEPQTGDYAEYETYTEAADEESGDESSQFSTPGPKGESSNDAMSDGASTDDPNEGYDPEAEEAEVSDYPGMPDFVPPEGWQRANLPAGAYWMTYGEVFQQPASDFPIQPGHRDMIDAPEIDGYAYLMGTAPMLTDLSVLMADGVRQSPVEGYECILTVTVEADGYHTSNTSFDMHVTEEWAMDGTDCEEAGKGSPMTQTFEYLASFEWVSPEGP